MATILGLLLFVCVAGVAHTYLVYPRLTIWAAARRCIANTQVSEPDHWPSVHVLMSVHNEDAIIERKLATLENQDYPGSLHLHLASDASRDRTDDILQAYAASSEQDVRLYLSRDRRGKPTTINALASAITDADAVLIITDASVLLQRDTIIELLRPMADPAVGIVDATMVHTSTDTGGISQTEDRYIRSEVRLKQAESCFGYMVGPFGGCFAIRRAAFRPVPTTFLVDDFYWCMQTYRQGYRGLSSRRAIVREAVGQRLVDEFRRKRRIGAGNWQNLTYFPDLWWPPYHGRLSYALFSHKILRWITPHLMVIGALAWAGLIYLTGNYWAGLLFVLVGGICILSLALPLLRLTSTDENTRRRVPALTYFLAMNVALLFGFFRYVNGIKSNIWQPSHRPPAGD